MTISGKYTALARLGSFGACSSADGEHTSASTDSILAAARQLLNRRLLANLSQLTRRVMMTKCMNFQAQIKIWFAAAGAMRTISHAVAPTLRHSSRSQRTFRCVGRRFRQELGQGHC